ncbi:molybdopterin dinucleotide binding domain-containing protein [uncultured Adlercreutzia sp.]|uniref:molybdopterin dinucleotide binding domain-containing protein n=1 Tax=uncultured Adlercreutzia sp. TaxID=875803 RepID=UPI0026F3BF8C|nr:molybdopterin dinucleotide binding domain-containing protein [uncultured Adlercreutzia sp.]
MREIDKEPLLHISRPDADNRGIASGDVVEVFNDRGRCVVKAVVDDALPEALCYIPKGWQRSQFIEGGYQELTANRADACAGSYVYYDTAVEVKKVEE